MTYIFFQTVLRFLLLSLWFSSLSFASPSKPLENAQYAEISRQRSGATKTITPSHNGVRLLPYEDKTFKEGTFLYRKRISAGKDMTSDWALFQGKLKQGGLSALKTFAFPDSWDLQKRFTYFKYGRFSGSAPQAKEVEHIYFNGDLVLVKGASAKLFVSFNGKTTELLPSTPPCIITVDAIPTGVKVFLNNRYQGQTPLVIAHAKQEVSLLEIRDPFTYNTVEIVQTRPGTRVNLNIILTKMQTWPDGSPVLPEATRALPGHDVNSLLLLYQSRSTPASPFVALENSDNGKRLFSLKSNAGKNSNDTTKALLQEYNASLNLLQGKRYQKAFSITHASFQPYDPKLGGVPVKISYGLDLYDFNFEGVVKVTSSEAAVLLNELKNTDLRRGKTKFSRRKTRTSYPSSMNKARADIWLVAEGNNLQTRTRLHNHKVIRLYDHHSLFLKFPNKEYELEGKFKYPAYIRHTTEWKKLRDPLF